VQTVDAFEEAEATFRPQLHARPAAPLSLADAASQLGIRPVQLAQAIRKGRVATVRGRRGELLVAQEEVERVRWET
jgi:hypothetical protein